MPYRQTCLGSNYDDLDDMLRRVLDFFGEIDGNPVLFSVFVMVLLHWDPGKALPADRAELYKLAFDATFRRAVEQTVAGVNDGHDAADVCATGPTRTSGPMVADMYRRVAAHLMLHGARGADETQDDGDHSLLVGSRVFRPADVKQALGEDWAAWQRLGTPLPLIRTLAVSKRGVDDEWQFKHKSFQEALFAHALIAQDAFADGACWGDGSAKAIFRRLNDKVRVTVVSSEQSCVLV
jgi:hypothetical protein